MKFHSWIALRKFTIVTDHNPLLYMLSQKNLSHALAQWLDIIIGYDFDIIHRPGIMHVLPDALSRLYSTTYDDRSLVWGTHNHIKFIKTADLFDNKSDSVIRDSISKDKQPAAKPLRRRMPPSGGGRTVIANDDNDAQAKIDSDAEVEDGEIPEDEQRVITVVDGHRVLSSLAASTSSPPDTKFVITNIGVPYHTLTQASTSSSSSSPVATAPAPPIAINATIRRKTRTFRARGSQRLVRFVDALPSFYGVDNDVDVEPINDVDLLDQEMSIQYGAGACWQAAALSLSLHLNPVNVTVSQMIINTAETRSGKDEVDEDHPADPQPSTSSLSSPAPAQPTADLRHSSRRHVPPARFAPPSTFRSREWERLPRDVTLTPPTSTSSSSSSTPSATVTIPSSLVPVAPFPLPTSRDDSSSFTPSTTSTSTSSSSPQPRASPYFTAPESSLSYGAAQRRSTSPTTEERMTFVAMRRGCRIPPPSERADLLKKTHQVKHQGVKAIERELYAQRIWWPGMRYDIEVEVGSCPACIQHTVVRAGWHPARSVHSAVPGAHWQVDLASMPETPDGVKWLLVLIDVFTGFVVLRALQSDDSEAVGEQLWSIFALLGPPRILQSDRAPNFTSAVTQTLCRRLGIEQRWITQYHPQADGKVESTIGKVKLALAKELRGAHGLWPLSVNFVQLAHNAHLAKLTGTSAYALMFGRSMNILYDFSRDGPPEVRTDDIQEWQQFQKDVTALIYPAVELRAKRIKEEYIKDLDNTRNLIAQKALPAGTVVAIKDPRWVKGGKAPSLAPKYLGHKFTVVDRTANGAYSLMDEDTLLLLDRRVPIDQLKVLRGPKFRRPTASSDDEAFQVDKILGHKMHGREHMYHVKWKGYTTDEATWEPADMFNDEGMIRRYWIAQGVNTPTASQRRYQKLKERRRRIKERNNKEDSADDSD
jgi:transposase InsO family protein